MININAKTDMLLIVDPQNDFIDGSLAVKDAADIIPILNGYIGRIPNVAISRDWHPANHSSFKSNGGIWPDHCVAGTRGASFHEGLLHLGFIVSKAMDPNVDAYSAFDGTELESIIKNMGITDLFIGGLATDYCVKATVLDALKIEGLKVFVLLDAIKAVNINPGDGDKALEEMIEAGAFPISF